MPGVGLGRTLGLLPFHLPPDIPILAVLQAMTPAQIGRMLADLAVVAAAIALLGTIESLLVFRSAQNLSGEPPRPVRDLLAQGVGNAASGLAGGLAISAAPGQTRTAYRNGARTRVVALTISAAIGLVAFLMPVVFAVIPVAVLSALLLQNAFQNFDRWSLRHALNTIRSEPSSQRRRAFYDLAIVFIVMTVTVVVTAVAGILIGIVLACLIFIINMSRPVIHRMRTGETLTSKRVRPEGDAMFLKETGRRRVAIELQGVLFFGNADDLYHKASELFAEADVIALDLRGVSDIDVSGSNILRSLVERSRQRKKRLLFCNVPTEFRDIFNEITGAGKDASIAPDLDSALEAMEEHALRSSGTRRADAAALPLAQHDFVAGVEPADLIALQSYLTVCTFSAGSVLGKEGDDADRMWIIVGGSVSVRLSVADARGSRRIVSLSSGTTVGELALLETRRRSAGIVADDEVTCYELTREAFDRLAAERPQLGAVLLRNLARQMARNLLRASEDIRQMTS
jgi:MFS superfamily sulfate permease-like transporter